MEFVHNNDEEEGGQGASLLYAFKHSLGKSGSPRIQFHGQFSTFVGVHDKVNKVWTNPKSFEAPLNTAPGKVIVRFGDIVEDEETTFPLCGVFFKMAEGRCDGVYGLMDAFPREERVLGLVKNLMVFKFSGEAASEDGVEKAGKERAD